MARRDRARTWGAAVVLALVVAEGAVLVLRPRDDLITPAPVAARSYFSAADLQRAEDFRGPQLLLGVATLAVEGAVLAALVVRPPRRLSASRGLARHPLVAGAGLGAAISVTLALAPLPLSVVARERSKDVGLVTQGWAGYVGDLALSSAIGAAFAGVGAALVLALMRRFPRGWWVAGAAGVVAVGAAFTLAGPVVLDPLFNTFRPLPQGRTRDDVLALAREAGLKVDRVEVVDASRRTTAVNAYVTGLGATKKVVLYDTLLKSFTPRETRLVVAHELGHVHHRDVVHGLLYLALVAPAGMFAVALLTRRLAPEGSARPGPEVLPALALSLALVATPVTWISNGLSRAVEARADAYSLRLTHDPDGFVAFERRIARQNVSDPDPPRVAHLLLGTHPTTLERLGIAAAFERGAR